MTHFFKFVFSGIIIMFFVFPYLVQAGDTGGPGQPSGVVTIVNPFKKDTIRGLIETIVNEILLPIGSVVAAVMIIYAGFLYVTAGGDPGQVKKAHEALLYAVIGAAILLGAWVISEAIDNTIKTLKNP